MENEKNTAKFEVRVKHVDEFGQISEGIAKSEFDYEHVCIQEFFEHFERALIAAGFSKESIDNYYKDSIGE